MYKRSHGVFLDSFQLLGDSHSLCRFLQLLKLALVVEIHRILDWQDGVTKTAVSLASIFCHDGRWFGDDQSLLLQLRNVLPHRVDAHAH